VHFVEGGGFLRRETSGLPISRAFPFRKRITQFSPGDFGLFQQLGDFLGIPRGEVS
jgi:hypothetical protein